MVWVRAVATAMLAGVLAKLDPATVRARSPAMPLVVRIGAAAAGLCGVLLTRRSVFAGVLAGEAAFLPAR